MGDPIEVIFRVRCRLRPRDTISRVKDCAIVTDSDVGAISISDSIELIIRGEAPVRP